MLARWTRRGVALPALVSLLSGLSRLPLQPRWTWQRRGCRVRLATKNQGRKQKRAAG
jgi:hypothetical protein